MTNTPTNSRDLETIKVDQEVIDAAREYYQKDLAESSPEGVSKDAMVFEGDKVKMDDNNLPVFRDSMEWPTNNGQLKAIIECCMAVIEAGIVPPNDVEGVFGLMDIIAKLERKRFIGDFNAEIPVNYFVGMVHVLNTFRTFQLHDGDKGMENAVNILALDFARRIDAYTSIKDRENIMAKKPEEVLSKDITINGGGYF